MPGAVTLTRHTRELSCRGVSRVVDEFVTGGLGSLRLLVRLNRDTGAIDARVISGTARARDLRVWISKRDASIGDVAGMLGDLLTGAYTN